LFTVLPSIILAGPARPPPPRKDALACDLERETHTSKPRRKDG
jgi:hypothetical protein